MLAAHENRRRASLGLDARGAALGAIGLLLFAATLSVLLARMSAPVAFLAATPARFLGAFGAWWLRRKLG